MAMPEQFIKQHALPYNEVHLTLPIEAMTTDEKLGLLGQFLSLEHKYLRTPHGISEQISPEAKIKFIVSYDVTQEKDFNGNLIHTRYADRPKDVAPKFGEGMEALGAISRWFEDKGERKARGLPAPSNANVINEITDVVYCLANLVTLDNNDREQYKLFIHQISDSLGMSFDELITLTVIKYNFRLGQGKSQKDHMIEDKIFEELLNQKNPDGTLIYHNPSDTELYNTHHKLTEIIDLLWGRMKTLYRLSQWGITPRK